YDGMERRTEQPRMHDETTAELVRHLGDPNGWWRDTAQQLIILRQDKSVVPELQRLARSSSNQLERIHALWTLDGLMATDAALIRELLKDPDPQIRLQAIRASETLYKAGDRSLADDVRALSTDPDVEVVMQVLMTLNHLKVPDVKELASSLLETNKAGGVQTVAKVIATTGVNVGRGGGLEMTRSLSPADL